MARMVLLHHTLPDGSFHFDWMIERTGDQADGRGPDARTLLTFALDEPPATQPNAEQKAIRLEDHRRRYLDYEGALSGVRGRVDRVLSGSARIVVESVEVVAIEGAFDTPDGSMESRACRWICRPADAAPVATLAEARGPIWRIRTEPVVPVGAARPTA